MKKTEVEKYVLDQLIILQDNSYAEFQSKLTPGISKDCFIGVRVPLLRKFAKEFSKNSSHIEFLNILPHRYFDENMLHGLLIEQIKNYDDCIDSLDLFLPFVDNWAVCDIMSPKVFSKNKPLLINKIKQWVASNHEYTIRFGLEMLMRYFLDDDFDEKYLDIAAEVASDEYYVNMMQAWFFATALTKQWDSTISLLESNRLNIWVHNKTIQKSIESFRISSSKKNYLKSLKRK